MAYYKVEHRQGGFYFFMPAKDGPPFHRISDGDIAVGPYPSQGVAQTAADASKAVRGFYNHARQARKADKATVSR